jgi:ATP-dependent DNA ligase
MPGKASRAHKPPKKPKTKTAQKSAALRATTLRPMEARLVDALPEEAGWQFEPKWDGFRCLVFKTGKTVALMAKSGKPLTRYFPEIVAAFADTKPDHFILDGELLIPVGKTLSFDALQMRLHPAQSRIDKLSRETPALFMAFDILADDTGRSYLDAPLRERRAALEDEIARLGTAPGVRLSPYSRKLTDARRWLARAGSGALDGVIAKPLEEPYQPEERAMLKVKPLRTADCVVGGFRHATGSRQVGSMLLGLYNDDGKLDHVGFTSGISNEQRPALTRKLEKLRGGSGFTGDAPGGPSRWSTERSAAWVPLKPSLVVEVAYDQVTGGRFRHGARFVRWRPDKAPGQCTFDQLQRESRPSKLIADVLGVTNRTARTRATP